MTYTVLGVFTNREDAEDAINHLEEDGYNPKDMSIVVKDTAAGEELATNTGANVTGGAVTGATTGAVVGGIAGLLIGIGAIAIPGVGALLIGGPLATALGLTGAAATTASGAATGAVAGGLIGALMGLGVPEDTARVYEDRVREGAILLAVPATTTEKSEEIKDILDEYDAENIETVSNSNGHHAEKSRHDADSSHHRSHHHA